MNRKLKKVFKKINKIAIGKKTLSELKSNVLILTEKYFPAADIILKNELCSYAEFYQNCYCRKNSAINFLKNIKK